MSSSSLLLLLLLFVVVVVVIIIIIIIVIIIIIIIIVNMETELQEHLISYLEHIFGFCSCARYKPVRPACTCTIQFSYFLISER